MIQNYIKLAFKVMLRKKYYTALTLIGISFTIMIVTVFASFIDQVIGANAPEINRSRTLILDKITLYTNGKGKDAMPSLFFLQKHLKGLESTETVSFSADRGFISSVNGKTAGHALKCTDENFWKITRFGFLEGRAFVSSDAARAARVAVISEKTRNYFFGSGAALGKSLSIYGQTFKVIGVVKPAAPFGKAYADVYVPYTTDVNMQQTEKAVSGTYTALLLSRTNDLKKVRAELRSRMRKIGNDAAGADSVKASAFTALEQFSKSSSSTDNEPEYGKTAIGILIIMTLFMLIPAISLVNLTVSRIGERAEEIGVRKSFGASSGTLAGQFIAENVLITLIGGIIGLGLAMYASELLIRLINSFDPLFKIQAEGYIFSWRVFGFCLFSCLFFGLLSGVYPAWKMSRMNVIYALKGGKSL